MICSSCKSWVLKDQYIEKTKMEQAIAQLKIDQQVEMAKRVAQIVVEKDGVISKKNDQMQTAANSLFGEQIAWSSMGPKQNLEAPRPVLIMHNRATEANAAIGLPPTPEAMKIEQKRLQDELDETKTSLDQLRKDSEMKTLENSRLVAATKIQEEKAAAAERAVNELVVNHLKALNGKQNEIIDKTNQIVALEKERADNKAIIAAQKWKIMTVLGVISLACFAGAIWSPLWKEKFIIGGVLAGALAAGIMYVQPWMLGLAAGVSILALAGWMVYQHNKESVAATSTYRAIQSIKDTAKEEYNKTVKPALVTWQTKYTSNGSSVPDPSIQKTIEDRLKQTGDL